MDDVKAKRVNIRLREYDYSSNGAYFITICVDKRENLLWNVGAIINRPYGYDILSRYGRITDHYISEVPRHYPGVFIDKYVIMPNHVHLIIKIDRFEEGGGRFIIAPTSISKIIQQLKRIISKEVGFTLWQRSFFEHIIRSAEDYRSIWQYIDSNPAKWAEDEYFRND